MICLDSLAIGTEFDWLAYSVSRFLHYRDSFLLLTLFSVPIPSLSGLNLTTRPTPCLDSSTIETRFSHSLFFLSRFTRYRDWIWLLNLFLVSIPSLSRLVSPTPLFSVSIPLLSGQNLTDWPFPCPNSITIETRFSYSPFFLSRFPRYRDWIWLLSLLRVPIPPLSRLVSPTPSFFCLDSLAIGTEFDYSTFSLSQFHHYRDRIWLLSLLLVPIPPLSRLVSPTLSFFCLDSLAIETEFDWLAFSLSQFHLYRDSFLLLPLFSVSIPLLSGLNLTTRPTPCLDSSTIETRFSHSLFFLSRFTRYRDWI